MDPTPWTLVIGIASSAVLAVAPWMLMVHAKLAVLSAQVTRLDMKVDKMCDCQQERLTWCVQHQSALDELTRRIEELS